ncbi:MAG: UDP-2,3-diacylglucosamine diphosphatase [Alphaproteobacteria bacterium]|nr:UDP-2,3-diacylglucosamine diphosphatase [Alphaproteobacteria bacterium]
MLVAVISDVHLLGLDDPAQSDLVSLLDSLRCPTVVLLGDLFHFWWGFEGVVYADYVPVLAALHRLRQRGSELVFVPGNHDFAVGPFLREALGARVTATLRLTLAGRRYLMVHGDEADSRPGYRIARRVLRGRPFAALMRALGPQGARRLGLSLAGASGMAHGDGPDPALVDAQRRWAQARISAGEADVVVMGHSHAPEVRDLEGGLYVNTGDFAAQRTWLAIGDVPALRRWAG